MKTTHFDYDYIIIGSGFGGSVAAMRLAQKGYSVAVMETGKRYNEDTYPVTNWNIRKSLWVPQLGLFGIWRLSFLKHVSILGAACVGGGSINYANTLYVPADAFFKKKKVRKIGEKKSLLPFYALAKKMLGVVENPVKTEIDNLVEETSAEIGRKKTCRMTPVAVYFGKPKERVKDPYFMGEGPERVGCELCGGCMTGCRFYAKNSLDKNYLYFAEKFGAAVIPEHKVTFVRPLDDDGTAGYEVEAARITKIGHPKKKFYARGVVFSAGVLGTLALLIKMKEKGILPRLSSKVGWDVCTNSEALIAVKSNKKDVDYSYGVAITSSVYPDDVTHIEPVRFSKGSDLFGLFPTVITDGGGKIPRQIRYVINIFRHPVQYLRWLNPVGFARRSVYLLVMQTLESAIRIKRARHAWWPFIKTLTTEKEKGTTIPVYIPVAQEFARRLAKRMDGMAGNNVTEILLNLATTAHILGGCCMSDSPETGVIDEKNRVFGYKNMLVCDGSMIPANLGVNPSLSIVAFTERAISFITPVKAHGFRSLKVEKAWKVMGLLQSK